MTNNGYDMLDRDTFTLVDKTLHAPTSIIYDRTGSRVGYADGMAEIADSENAFVLQYVLYWGDASGKLTGYGALDTIAKTGVSTKYVMMTNSYIPQQATCLLAYGSDGSKESADCSTVDIPDSAKFSSEVPLYSFQVLSDVHIAAWDSIADINFDSALKDIKKTDPSSSAVVFVGDSVDCGQDATYQKFMSIINANKVGLPNFIYAIGNHEYMETVSDPYEHSVDGKLQKWLNYTKAPGVYYDKYIGGQHFIIMGSEESAYHDDDCDISQTQFDWLKSKLAETKNKKEPIYLYLHQSMSNTVAGSIGMKGTPDAQGWYGMKPNQEIQLRDILKKYPQVVLFNGHSHWTLESDHEMYDGKNAFASIFNTASVGYLWSDAQASIYESEGLYVEVYPDRLLVRGRNFTKSTWIPKASLVLDLNEKCAGISTSNQDSASIVEQQNSNKAGICILGRN